MSPPRVLVATLELNWGTCICVLLGRGEVSLRVSRFMGGDNELLLNANDCRVLQGGCLRSAGLW